MVQCAYSCANGHLVVGFFPERCPECDRAPVLARWEYDLYVLYVTESAHRRGLLQGLDMSEVQVALGLVHEIHQNRSDRRLRELRFEQDMLLMNPEMYRKVQEHKKMQELEEQEDGGSQIEWRVPSSPEEAREIAAELARVDQAMVAARRGNGHGPDGWSLSSSDLDEMDD